MEDDTILADSITYRNLGITLLYICANFCAGFNYVIAQTAG